MSRVAVSTTHLYQQGFGPASRRIGVRGLGAASICLDQAQNAIDCQDPECTYGDCGAPSGYVPTGGCLDQHENQVMCMDPECTYGDCLAPATPKPPGSVKTAVQTFPQTVGLPAGPSPRLNVPVSSSIPGSFGLWFENSTLISGFPNWVVLASVAAGALVLSGSFGSGKGRKR